MNEYAVLVFEARVIEAAVLDCQHRNGCTMPDCPVGCIIHSGGWMPPPDCGTSAWESPPEYIFPRVAVE